MAPILIAAGILGGGITLVSLSWLEPLGIALIAAGAIGFFWSRTRTRCASTSGVCTDSGCGCTTSTTTAS
ncbi:hypothetical protein ACQP2U_40295 [Nocardia sp. CA-084685]|uniref:hypothetical protein n=1 Tax=Nocardia sp. CA-084685 TaxID=3239970 RepID=UPI003D978CD1